MGLKVMLNGNRLNELAEEQILHNSLPFEQKR